ncbi:hypothetical protein HLB44_12280 [Aquincola sp. S2]|uniref:Uncharacterized protein n=1 Tax=Pseudaquabacterium terrae TaxID=2732868 RepID=A0ABX2EGL4_9BURK|nr:hypothetical protein [Aquabacterium terrae]NRF67763.1 hypothetical protein [Aquabacterium terrae]
MSIELQILSSVLGTITARAVQARLRTTCFAPIASVYVDHADVATPPVAVIAVNTAVQLRVPLDVFIARREDILAAPNAVPAGATVPAGRVLLLMEIATSGPVLSAKCIDADLGQLGEVLEPVAPAVKAAIVEAVGSPMTVNLATALGDLGMPEPSSSRVELVGNIVTIRFEPTGSAFEHLFPGQEWGLFLDGAAVERLATSRVPVNLGSRITSMTLQAHWRPEGTAPHVDIDYAGKAQVPDPFAGDLDGTMGCDLSLTPTITKSLRTTVHWSLHVDLGDLVPGFIDNAVQAAIADAMDPATFGGTPVGDHAFAIDSPLPEVVFGGARFGYASAVASPAGMTIGGLVRLPLDLGTDTLQPVVTQFGLPLRRTSCRSLARRGSGDPNKTVLLSEVKTHGRVWLEGYGAFCGIEVVSPGQWIEPYINRAGDTPEVMIAIPSAVALGIVEPVRLLVRTARGVRLVDLGTPPPVQLNAAGEVINAQTTHLPNCLSINVEHGIRWARGGGLLDQSVVNPPMERPDWRTFIGRHHGIDVQLVTLSALEPGELIQFRSHDHSVDVTADRNGRALVPVFLPAATDQIQASLIRVNRRNIADHFAVRTAIFMDQASLPAGTQHRLAAIDGTAVLTTEFGNHVDVHEIGSLGAPMLLKRETASPQESGCDPAQAERRSEVVALNPQPLPRDELARRWNLPGIRSLVAVPGFAEAPIALATMADGSILVLDLGEEGAVRVAGTFTGPLGGMDVAGDWAIVADPKRVSIYRVTRDAEDCPCESSRHRESFPERAESS